ncbi:MAG: VWA domain-containing protein [Deltaproteobacteria bacterium]|nr:VWA domain-containing protein [Deltaproteobacteria bacterium]
MSDATEVKAACARVREELADIVDGDAAALARHGDHLADCDDCRDARFAAAEAAEELKAAGADHVAPSAEALEKAVLARLDARPAPAANVASAPVASAPVASAPVASAPVASVKAAAAVEVAKPAAAKAEPAAPAKVRSIDSARGGRSRKLLIAAAVCGVAAAAAASVFAVRALKQRSAASAASAAKGSAKVIAISRAAADGQTGITFAGQPVALGNAVTGGKLVATDGRTRVKLQLGDGTTLTLNHDTRVELTGPRALKLTSGEVVADIATGEALVSITMPTGRVQAAGSLLAIAAEADQASVRVARGHARIEGTSGTLEVLAGEEALVPRTGKGSVAPAARLADAVGWSELEGEPTDTTLAGLGELRARKPGDKSEKERPLTLANHKVTIRVSGNVARTEIEESFKNDSADTLEGIYRFPLPPDARIDRLALWVGDKLEEGAFVERGHAAKIWKGVIHNAAPSQPVQLQEIVFVPDRFRDPALLEWQRGGRFELKIYPIPARGERKVILSYTQTIAPQGKQRRYVYPLAHSADASTKVGHFEVDARLVGHDQSRPVHVHGYKPTESKDGVATKLSMTADDFQPAGDLIVDYSLPGDAELRYWTAAAEGAQAAAAKIKNGKAPADESTEVTAARATLAADPRSFVLLALRPEIPAYTENHARDFLIVVDSSQSMTGERFSRATALTAALVGNMDRRDRVRVMVCDADCRELGSVRAPSAQAATEVRELMGAVRPAGASNLVASLTAAARAWPRESGSGASRELRVMYLGDGMSSTGPRRAASLVAEIEELSKATTVKVTTVGIGADVDTVALAGIARAGGGHYVPYVPGERVGASALAVLETTYGPVLSNAALELPAGVTEVSPAKLPTLRAGEEVLVSARFAGEIKGDIVLRGSVGGKPYEDRYPIALTPAATAGNGFVPRVWAQQRIDELDQAGRGEDRAQIVALSKTYGVLSRQTSLLVLESESMFNAMGIERGGQPARWTGEDIATAGEASGTIGHAQAQMGVLAGADADGEESEATGVTGGLEAGGGGKMGGVGTGSGDGFGRASASTRDPMAKTADEKSDKAKKAPMEARRESAPAPTARPMPDAPRNMAADDMWEGMPATGGRSGTFMKKVWFRVGAVSAGAFSDGSSAISLAEQRLAQMPESRDRLRSLVQALARAGQVDRALTENEAWLAKAPSDADALVSLADLTARKGDRAGALRYLSGIVDLSPDAPELHERLAGAYQRLGDFSHECAHRVAIAELGLGSSNATAIGAGVRCERAAGRESAAARLLAGTADAKLRSKAETAAATPAPAPRKVELSLNASWGSDADLDVALVAPSGSRISFMGGRKISADPGAAITAGRERLGIPKIAKGSYLVEITRSKLGDTTPVAGEVEITVLGVKRVIPFTLSTDRVVLGRIDVTSQFKWVQVARTNGGWR